MYEVDENGNAIIPEVKKRKKNKNKRKKTDDPKNIKKK